MSLGDVFTTIWIRIQCNPHIYEDRWCNKVMSLCQIKINVIINMADGNV